jgi:hypothetical protein
VTTKEARAFLNADAFDDLEEAYDQLLFDQKQFFLQKACIPKVFDGKIEKLNHFTEASIILGLEFAKMEAKLHNFHFSEDTMLDVYRSYAQQLNESKKKLSQAVSFGELKTLVEHQLQLFLDYTSKWPLIAEFQEGLKLSSEPDPVVFFQELKLLESQGISTFAQLVNSAGNIGVIVKKESTRLHSLHTTK